MNVIIKSLLHLQLAEGAQPTLVYQNSFKSKTSSCWNVGYLAPAANHFHCNPPSY